MAAFAFYRFHLLLFLHKTLNGSVLLIFKTVFHNAHLVFATFCDAEIAFYTCVAEGEKRGRSLRKVAQIGGTSLRLPPGFFALRHFFLTLRLDRRHACKVWQQPPAA